MAFITRRSSGDRHLVLWSLRLKKRSETSASQPHSGRDLFSMYATCKSIERQLYLRVRGGTALSALANTHIDDDEGDAYLEKLQEISMLHRPDPCLSSLNDDYGLIVMDYLAPALVLRVNNNLVMGKMEKSIFPMGTSFVEHNGAQGLAGHTWPLVPKRTQADALAIIMAEQSKHRQKTRTLGCDVIPKKKKVKGVHNYDRNEWKSEWDTKIEGNECSPRFPWIRRDDRSVWCFVCHR
jgi:hypothetical protein